MIEGVLKVSLRAQGVVGWEARFSFFVQATYDTQQVSSLVWLCVTLLKISFPLAIWYLTLMNTSNWPSALEHRAHALRMSSSLLAVPS